jgi:hypothetical protein
VLFLAFPAEAEGFVVEMRKFLGGFHSGSKIFGQSGALTDMDARWVT